VRDSIDLLQGPLGAKRTCLTLSAGPHPPQRCDALTSAQPAIKLAPMKNLLLTSMVSACLAAAPGGSWADELGQFLSEKGLLSTKAVPAISPKASELVVHAMGFLGVPYKWGGNEAETGLDCSGFVRAVFQQITGVVLPRTSDRQAAATQSIATGELAPGDLVFFNTMQQSFSHVGIYIGNGKFVHAPRAGDRIKLDQLSNSYWKPRFDGARRVAHANMDASGPSKAKAPTDQEPGR
jgi:hypothetical protein